MKKYLVQLAVMMGNHSKNIENITTDDFYTLVMLDSDKNKGIRLKTGRTLIFQFKTEIEQNNFINYLKTDFVRFCLSLIKINADTGVGELKLIPWLNFKEEWDDEKLFKHFNIDKEMQDYIRNFLPDYYGLRS